MLYKQNYRDGSNCFLDTVYVVVKFFFFKYSLLSAYSSAVLLTIKNKGNILNEKGFNTLTLLFQYWDKIKHHYFSHTFRHTHTHTHAHARTHAHAHAHTHTHMCSKSLSMNGNYVAITV